MAKIVVETFGDNALQKIYLDLSHKDDWDEECELCRMPTLLHRDTTAKRIQGSCTRRTELTDAAKDKAEAKLMKEWTLFKKKMRPIRNFYRDDMEKKQTQSDILEGFQSMADAIIE